MKKRALTLLEIMIVIFLITLITGTIGYNMRGTLDKGRAFRTERAQEQLRDLLLICLAEDRNATAEQIAANPKDFLIRNGLAKDPEGLLNDGWNQPFEIKVKNKNDFSIKSQKMIHYQTKMGKSVEKTEELEE